MTLIRMSDARLNKSQAMLNEVAQIYLALKDTHRAIVAMQDFDLCDDEIFVLVEAAREKAEQVILMVDGAIDA